MVVDRGSMVMRIWGSTRMVLHRVSMVMGIGGRDMDLTSEGGRNDGADEQHGEDAVGFATHHSQHRFPFRKRPTT